MRVLLLALALLGLLVAAPRVHVGEPVAESARAAPGPVVLPRGWAIDRLRRLSVEFPRVDRVEAKLTTQAEWYRVSGSAPLPAQPTRAPGSAPAVVDAAAMTPVVPPGAAERLVWLVAASGAVHPQFQRGRDPLGWGVLILDARTGQALGMVASAREPWPPSWDQVVDQGAGGDWVLGPGDGPHVPRAEAERRVYGGAGWVRSWMMPAGAAARTVGADPLPAWLDPRRQVWLVVARDGRPGPGGRGYALVDASLGADLVVGPAARIDAPD